MRPGEPLSRLENVSKRILTTLDETPTATVSNPNGHTRTVEISVFSGTWQHDLDQINLLPGDKVCRCVRARALVCVGVCVCAMHRTLNVCLLP